MTNAALYGLAHDILAIIEQLELIRAGRRLGNNERNPCCRQHLLRCNERQHQYIDQASHFHDFFFFGLHHMVNFLDILVS